MDAGAWQYSAYAFTVKAATRIPGRTPVTPSPTASTTPAASMPGVSGSFGFTTYSPLAEARVGEVHADRVRP